MISREIGLLRHVDQQHYPLSAITGTYGTEAIGRHLRELAGLFCDHDLPRSAIVRLPPLGSAFHYDGKPVTVYGYSLRVRDQRLSLCSLLEDSCQPGHLKQVPYWEEAVELNYRLQDFQCRAQHPAAGVEATLAILDVARHLYSHDISTTKAIAVAKVAHAICKHNHSFTLHFTANGIFALSQREYLGAVPRTLAAVQATGS